MPKLRCAEERGEGAAVKKKSETRWAIVGVHGIYCSHEFTRRDAIWNHCSMLGQDWKECRRRGDRAVNVRITWEEKP